jgi:hypothetical protein
MVMKRFILIILTLLAVANVKAEPNQYEAYFHEDNDCYSCAIISQEERTVAIYGKSKSTAPDLIIPLTIAYNGTEYTVTKIIDFGFNDSSIFNGSHDYETLTLPPTINEISDGEIFCAFFNLKRVNISDFVAWLAIDIPGDYNNPTVRPECLFLNGEEIKGDIVVPDGVETVGNCGFLTAVTSATLPASVKRITANAFTCSNVYIYATEPPQVVCSGFYNTIFPHTIAWVPAGSLEKYKADEKWSQVSDLREMSVDEMTAYDTNGIGDVAINNVVKVSTVDGGIAISTTEATEVAIYSTTGALAKALRVSGEETVSLAPGLYIVRAADKSYKVRV